MKKWEYLSQYYTFDVPESEFNRFGREGWELISVIKSPKDIYGETCRFIFKREKIEEVKPIELD